jgi:hypothetical protein
VGSALADAQRVDDFGGELGFEHVVDFGGAEADSGGVEDAVGAAQEEDLFGCWVDGDEVAVGPDVCIAG